jgi:hypothetical protein
VWRKGEEQRIYKRRTSVRLTRSPYTSYLRITGYEMLSAASESAGSGLGKNMACACRQRLDLVNNRAAADLDGVERARAGRGCSAWWASWRRG